MADRIRYLAYTVLERQAAAGSYSNITLDHIIRREELSGVDRAFLTALVYGTIEKQHTIDYYLARLSARPFAGLHGSVKTILRLGAYQVLFMDRVPDHAACDESVELTQEVESFDGFTPAYDFPYSLEEAGGKTYARYDLGKTFLYDRATGLCYPMGDVIESYFNS